MTDHNTNQAEEQAAKTEALINQAAEYMFNNFRWKDRIGEVTEVLSSDNPSRLDAALASFMGMDALTLRLLLDDVAMGLCEDSAKVVVWRHGEDWLVFLEGVDYE